MEAMRGVTYRFIYPAMCLAACDSEEGKQTEFPEPIVEIAPSSQEYPLNLSLFLDLSDRIDSAKYPESSMQVYERDLGNIKAIGAAFTQHCLNKPLILMDDEFHVFFHPAPPDPDIDKLARTMSFRVDNSVTKEDIAAIVPTIAEGGEQIYALAMKQEQYPGSDIWEFMDQKAAGLCIEKKEDVRNVLVILTDGYMYYERNKRPADVKAPQANWLLPPRVQALGLTDQGWENKYAAEGMGFLPVTANLAELEVLVLGINPSKNNAWEGDVIKRFWTDWLQGMGVKRFELLDADLPYELEEAIHRFVLGVQ